MLSSYRANPNAVTPASSGAPLNVALDPSTVVAPGAGAISLGATKPNGAQASPQGYIQMSINGTNRYVPYF